LTLLTPRLIEFLEARTGILLKPGRQQLIETRISELCRLYEIRGPENLIQRCDNPEFYNELLTCLTVNETLWFRDDHPFGFVLEYLSSRAAPVRIWSAACATGQEPYSLAILLKEAGLSKGVSILGTDLDPEAIKTAQKGAYDSFSIARGLSEDLRRRYFESRGREYVLNEEIRRMVEFRQHNLLDRSPRGPFDLVLLRNVLIYFGQPTRTKVAEHISFCLTGGGVLLLGASETAVGLHPELKLKSQKKTIYFEKITT